MPIQTSDNKWSEYKWIVNKTAGLGTHTTIQAAIDAASAGDAIWVYPDTYEEDLTISKKLSIDSSFQNNSVLLGKITPSERVSFNGFDLTTNNDYIIECTSGSADLYLFNCNIVMTNHDAISQSAGYITFQSFGTSFASGYKIFDKTGGQIIFDRGSSVGNHDTASTSSAGPVIFINGYGANFFTTSGTSSVTATRWNFGIGNHTITIGGSGTNTINQCSFSSGTASCLTIDTTTTIQNSMFTSTNTNAITGSGTLQYDSLSFTNSSTINTSTVTPLYDRLAYTRAPNLGIGVDPGTTAGITFDGSNYLSFYESGSWTPDLKFGGASVGLTYSFRQGSYVRIGDMVWISCVFLLTNVGSSTGDVTIEGLPFTPNSNYFFFPVTQNYGITPSSGYVLAFQTINGNNYLSGVTYNNIGGNAVMTTSNTTFSNSAYLTFQNCYSTT